MKTSTVSLLTVPPQGTKADASEDLEAGTKVDASRDLKATILEMSTSEDDSKP